MTVQPTITIVFVNGTGAKGSCKLTGASTATAQLNFGTASIAGGDNQSCVTFTKSGTTSYTLANQISLLVKKQNSTSGSFTVQASLASAALAGVTWSLEKGAITLTTTPQTVTGGSYAKSFVEDLQVNVLSSVAAGNLDQTIDFLVTAN